VLVVCYQKGVTPITSFVYNELVMLTVRDAAQQTQFASARVLAPLPGLSTAVSSQSPFASAS